MATILLARCGERMDRRDRATLTAFLATERSAGALARLGARGARDGVGPP